MREHWLVKTQAVRPILGIEAHEMKKYNPLFLSVLTPNGDPLHVREFVLALHSFLDNRKITTDLVRWFCASPEAIRIGSNARQHYALTAARMAKGHVLTRPDIKKLFDVSDFAIIHWAKGGLTSCGKRGNLIAYRLQDVMRLCLMRGPGA